MDGTRSDNIAYTRTILNSFSTFHGDWGGDDCLKVSFLIIEDPIKECGDNFP